jgi:hypothetical protein
VIAKNNRSRQSKQDSAANLRPEKLGEALDILRKRAELSMNELARLMGYKGQSSIQRYLDHEYDLPLRPTIAARFQEALVGKGNPPIAPHEFAIASAARRDLQEAERLAQGLLNLTTGQDVSDFSLPLSAGKAHLVLPQRLSGADIQVLQMWFDFILTLAKKRRTPESGK